MPNTLICTIFGKDHTDVVLLGSTPSYVSVRRCEDLAGGWFSVAVDPAEGVRA